MQALRISIQEKVLTQTYSKADWQKWVFRQARTLCLHCMTEFCFNVREDDEVRIYACFNCGYCFREKTFLKEVK